MDKLQEHVERALHAHYRFRLDQHYMIHKDKIVIVDEGTGRPQPDRHWRDGLHQAVEAKEGVPITVASDHAAQITYQSYFRLYKKLAGMTGTAAQNWWELRRVYKLWVVCVPTNRPVIRQQWPDRIFPTEEAKFDAVVEEIQRLKAQGRPVLIGTRSVEKSEKLSLRLKKLGIEHQVLNARQLEKEAQIVAQAGQPGKVTIATNMAGRGTDIKLGPGVAEAGGLHVLGTERHDARRIDRQLAGRAGRQGDPGSAQFFLSLEDELLEGLGPDQQEELKEFGQRHVNDPIDWQRYARLFLKAQRRLERRHRRQRIDLMVYERNRREILKDLGADPYVD
jgi:preprotein translocase subunit SecA